MSFVSGNALTCQICLGGSGRQKCDPNNTRTCEAGIEYCFAVKYMDRSGAFYTLRGCDEDFRDRPFCPNAEKSCHDDLKKSNWTAPSCVGFCCKTDNCNNFTPSTSIATGIMVTKFTLIPMVMAGLVA